MNPTKNVKYIEVDEEVFLTLCETKYDEKVLKIQEKYHEFEKEMSGKIVRWMKIKDEDIYFDTVYKVLFPDTRKMKLTYWASWYYDSYEKTLEYLNSCAENVREENKKAAEQQDMILPSKCSSVLAGLEANYVSTRLLVDILSDGSCPCLNMNGELEVKDGKSTRYVIVDNEHVEILNLIDKRTTTFRYVSSVLNVSVHKFTDKLSAFQIMVKYGLYPSEFSDDEIEKMKAFRSILENNIAINNFVQLKEYLKINKVPGLLDIDLRPEAIENCIEAEEIDLTAESGVGYKLKNYFDECDYLRARIQKYNSKWYLSDEGRGLWELWQETKNQSNAVAKSKQKTENQDSISRQRIIKLSGGAVARNPLYDVKHNAVVGIDFGTKSTIVALQDGDEQIIPLRVGMADYSIAPEESHFENPTVMQFVDLNHFLKQYRKSEGRPWTNWNCLLVSHEAFENLIESENSMEMASFVTDIKQWAGGKYNNKDFQHLIIKDAKGNRYDIDGYMNLTEEDIDLIEIYAYYIGLFINNMHTGIYLDYLLSFPETFSKEVRERLLHSFTKGIRKSIPSVVFQDEECATTFRVRQGPSEPAAYAACAFEQYGIEPTDQGVFYGIFDFGGGTTDYDYGIWKTAPEDEYTYNYIIRHFGSGGDKTLGGENILQLLAYSVFSDDTKQENGESNLDIMRKNKLVYYRPDEGKRFPGTEALNNNSESAMLNTKLMMEALRPIWEEWESFQKWYTNSKRKGELQLEVGVQNVSLVCDKNSSVKANLKLFSDTGRVDVTLYVDMQMVEQIIYNRIESGVRNFFEGITQAYQKVDKDNKTKIHIFLAGNSSKSERVKRFFKDYVISYNASIFAEDIAEIKEKTRENQKAEIEENQTGVIKQHICEEDELIVLNNMDNNHFVVYPSLGTDTAKKIQKSRGVSSEYNSLMAPTGKTGVAFGLVMCREGSMIKVESEIKKTEQIKLNYYIGVNYRKNFKLIFDKNVGYNKWLKFSKVSAETETFEFYYSELPEVQGNNVVIKENKSIYKRKCLIDNVVTDASIYFRFISPSQLEYVVATDDKICNEEYISKIYKVSL